MIRIEDSVLVLLAAGRSARFGDVGSKLAEPFLARPLGLHVAVALGAMPFARRFAVIARDCPLDYAAHGFVPLVNEDAAQGMGTSVRVGIAAARACGATAAVIALADMPRVTAAHVHRLFDAATAPDAVVASSDGHAPRPPALFAAAHFDELLQLSGDEGARRLIARGRHVVASAAELIDVDTPAELEQLRALVHAPEAGRQPVSG